MPVYGGDVDLGIGFQTSYGTIASIANSVSALPILSTNLSPKRPLITQQNISGVYDEGANYLGMQEVSGEIEMEAHPISIGYMFGSFFGTASITNSDNIYSHQFQGKSAPFDGSESFKRPVTLVQNNIIAGAEANFYNLVANTLEVGIANGELIKVKAGFVGGRDDNGSTAFTATYPAGTQRFSWDVSSVSLTGVGAITEISDLTINCEDPVEPSYTLNNTVWPSKNVLTGMRKCSISATLHYETNSIYEFYKDKDEADLTVSLEDKSTEIQSGYYNKLVMVFRGVRLETAEYNNTGPGETMLTIAGNATYDSSNSDLVRFTLTNTKDAY